MSIEGNGWSRNEMYVLETLRRIETLLIEIQHELKAIEARGVERIHGLDKRVTTLEVRASLFGALSGAAVMLIGSIVRAVGR